MPKEDLEEWKAGTACLVMNPIPFSYEGQEIPQTELHKDETVTVNGVRLRIVGITENPVCIGSGNFHNGVQVIVTDSLYDMLTGDDRFSEVCPTLEEDADAETFEKWLDEWCGENPGTYWLSYRQAYEQMAESFEQIRFLCWGLILFIGLIGILNIVNTVYVNIHTRIGEIGMPEGDRDEREKPLPDISVGRGLLWPDRVGTGSGIGIYLYVSCGSGGDRQP